MTKALLKQFEQLYPDPRSELNFVNNYQLITAVMLSAQCTDKKVNEVTPELFERYPDFRSLSKATVAQLEKILRPVNYYKTKSRHLIEMAKRVEQDFAGEVPSAFEDLISLAGVGQKTANVIQSELGIRPAFPVDTHVFRVSKRLGIAEGNNPEQVEESLKTQFKPALWRNLHHWLIFHGRRVCKARKPLCKDCAVAKYCQFDEKSEV